MKAEGRSTARHRMGTFAMVLGLIALLAAAALFAYNHVESRRAGDSADAVLDQLVATIVGDAPDVSVARDPDSDPDDAPAKSAVDPYGEMPTVMIDGNEYIGFLTVESVGLELPVMSSWDYDKLTVSPCRYTGKVWTNDLVIAAHNYDRHFGMLFNASPGDDVLFTDVRGATTRYKIVAIEILDPFAVTEMTAGEYDLSLFTCTYGGRTRFTVRCNRA